MDLRATSAGLLMPQMGIQPVTIQTIDPLPAKTVGLILGWGSLTLQGLVVHPGLVDEQHVPAIQVLCSSPQGIFSIKTGDRIAQLLLLPGPYNSPGPTKKQMGSSGPDSAYLAVQLNARPKMDLWINGKRFEGILDTGADKSIISSHWWPQTWPITKSSHSLQGLGYQSCPDISSAMLSWTSPEGHQGKFTPYVLPLPINLWGRDVMIDMGLTLTNEYSTQAIDIMRRMGYKEGKGLGRQEQGLREPISSVANDRRQGLGFS